MVGDDTILICDLHDLRLKRNVDYSKYLHSEIHCPNVFTWIDYDKEKNTLEALLSYFPTIDTEKLTLEMV